MSVPQDSSLKFTNCDIARLLREVAAAYEMKGDEHFRVRAYDNAADAVEHAAGEVRDLWEAGQLEEVGGIGEGIAAHLDEYFRTGKVRHFSSVKKGLPSGVFNLLDIPGVGAKTAYKLAKELKVGNVQELYAACTSHRVAGLEGFGEESEQRILKGIAELERRKKRILLPVALALAQEIMAYLKRCSAVHRADPLGSLRRGAATIGDIDIAVAADDAAAVIDHFVKYAKIHRVLSRGRMKASVLLKSGYQIDLVVQKPAAYGALLQYFTGSKAHNIHLRQVARDRELSLSEHGVKKLNPSVSSGQELKTFSDEEGFYKALGMGWIPPELREDWGEIEAALKGKLPNLIETVNIKGDLHMHSSHSDGEDSVGEMVKRGRSLGYKYLAITDHNPSLGTRGKEGVAKFLKEYLSEVKRIDTSERGIRIFGGLEVSITAEAKMALPDTFLKELDFIIGAVHTAFQQSHPQITKRLLTAIENPYVKFIAHPTGRSLNKREGYDADWDKIFRACLKHDTALEINAYPSRLDLPDILVREAVRRGVKLVINSDAHAVEHLEFMDFGVAVARRGWAAADNVINTWPRERLEKWLFRGKLG